LLDSADLAASVSHPGGLFSLFWPILVSAGAYQWLVHLHFSNRPFNKTATSRKNRAQPLGAIIVSLCGNIVV
jgi:hypothetical protein